MSEIKSFSVASKLRVVDRRLNKFSVDSVLASIGFKIYLFDVKNSKVNLSHTHTHEEEYILHTSKNLS